MNIKLKKLDEGNFEDFFFALNEMEIWAHGKDMDEGAKERLKNHYFRDKPMFQCFVVYAEDKRAGFVSFYETYATMEARPGLYIEDIFILEEYRNKGIGKFVINELLKIAKEKKYCRVDLLSFGEGPRKFYEKIGAEFKNNFHYRFNEELIEKGILQK